MNYQQIQNTSILNNSNDSNSTNQYQVQQTQIYRPYLPPEHSRQNQVIQSQNQNNCLQETFAKHPTQMFCYNCQQQIISEVSYECGKGAYLMCSLMCIFGLWAVIPLLGKDCKDSIHYCNQCKIKLCKRRFIFN